MYKMSNRLCTEFNWTKVKETFLLPPSAKWYIVLYISLFHASLVFSFVSPLFLFCLPSFFVLVFVCRVHRDSASRTRGGRNASSAMPAGTCQGWGTRVKNVCLAKQEHTRAKLEWLRASSAYLASTSSSRRSITALYVPREHSARCRECKNALCAQQGLQQVPRDKLRANSAVLENRERKMENVPSALKGSTAETPTPRKHAFFVPQGTTRTSWSSRFVFPAALENLR